MYTSCSLRTRGLTLIEVAVALVSIAFLAAILLPATGKSRATNWANQDLANLGKIYRGMQSYVLDYQDLLPNFTQVTTSKFTDLMAGPSDTPTQLAAKQATEIIRRRGNRDQPLWLRYQWFPHPQYSHLVIADYLEFDVPSEVFVSPSDLVRSKWMNWQQFENDAYVPMQPVYGSATHNRTLPYSSSYRANLASYDRLASVLDDRTVVRCRVRPATDFGQVTTSMHNVLGGTTLPKVKYPSRKVYYNASEQFNFKGKRLHYAVNEAQVSMVFFDGSASLRMTGSANPGWDPWRPEIEQAYRTFYTQNRPWQPPVLGSASSPTRDLIENRYTTTRDGLLGIDY